MSPKTGLPKTAKRLLPLVVICSLIAANFAPLFAQTTPCGDYDCVDQSEFATDDPARNGWVAGNGGTISDTELGWLASKSFGALWWATSAQGVLTAKGTKPLISKIVYLEPGRYRMVLRVGSDKVWGIIGNQLFTRATPPGGTTFGTGSFSVSDSFKTLITDEFTVSSPGDVMIEFSGQESVMLFFDYVWVVKDTTATPTPGPGTPSATPLPATSTPIPTPTPFCIDAPPTATPGPPQFQLTPTPSPTPNPQTSFTVLDQFVFVTLSDIWEAAGNGVYVSLSTGRATAKPGAVFIPYSVDPPGWTFVDMERTALIWQPSTVLSSTIYVDGWGRADIVPQGTSAFVEVWKLDAGTLLWSQAGTSQISAGNWYNFHQSLSSAGGIAAVAFLTSRSDAPTSGGLYIDDIYMYGDLANAPFCDGTYISPPGGGTEPTDTTVITIPADRTCPPDVRVPNNFWGPLLAQLTLFLDAIFAFAPGHTPGSITLMLNDLVASPFGTYTILASVFFDLRVSAVMTGLILLMEGVRAIWSIWLAVKKTIPFV